MSIENIFNSPATRASLKSLESKFNKMIGAINSLDLGEPANIFIKVLRDEYIKHRKAITDANVDVDANIDYTPKARVKRGTPVDTAEPDTAIPTPTPAKPLTAAEKLKAAKASKKEESLTD